MSRLLVLGSSQAASFYLAHETLEAQEGLQTDWLVTPANLGFEIDPQTSRIQAPESYLQHRRGKSMQVIGGREDGIFACDYDAIAYCSVGLRPPGRLETHPVHALAQMPVSDGLLRAMIANHENMQIHGTNLTAIRAAGFAGQLICEQWLRPGDLPGSLTMAHWQRACDMETACLAAQAEANNARLMPRPDGMTYLTDAALLDDPERMGVHGNKTYAEAMAKTLLSMLQPVSA